jgi:hypothetical protein
MVSALQLKPMGREATDFSVFSLCTGCKECVDCHPEKKYNSYIYIYIKEPGWEHIYGKEHKKAIDLLSFSVSYVWS